MSAVGPGLLLLFSAAAPLDRGHRKWEYVRERSLVRSGSVRLYILPDSAGSAAPRKHLLKSSMKRDHSFVTQRKTELNTLSCSGSRRN
jgi:hypothetical protein